MASILLRETKRPVGLCFGRHLVRRGLIDTSFGVQNFSLCGAKGSLRVASAASTNAINRDRSRSEEDQCECDRPQRQWKFVAAIAHKPVLPVDPGDSHDHIHENSKGN